MTIAGRAVLVTGANRGVGQARVEEALKRGAKRVYAGTRQPLSHVDGRVTPLTLDVTNAVQIQDAVERVESLDILVNNAGVALFDSLQGRPFVQTEDSRINSWQESRLACFRQPVTFEIAKKGNKTEVHFTHVGLVPDHECYGACSNAWGSYINGSLPSLITTGKGQPNQKECRGRAKTISTPKARIIFPICSVEINSPHPSPQ